MSKNEIMECIEANNAVIAREKNRIKQLTKISALIVAYEEGEFNNSIGGVEKINDEIATCMAAIDEAKARQVKRNKQLKLLEKLEELNN